LLEKSATYGIIFSLEAFLVIFTFVRMSKKTSKFYLSAPLILSFGSILLTVYYLIIGLLLPGSGHLEGLQSEYYLLNIIGTSLILFGNLMFIYQIFMQVVLEKGEE